MQIEDIDFDLRQLLEDLAGIFGQPAQAKGLELICSVPDDLPVAVSGDPVRMRQILTNLVSNAVKFTSQGEVVIRLKLVDDSPRLARYRFEVQDAGIGIGEEEQARLFSAFAQADSSTTRRYGGSGLGLAIAKRLVELMDGQIGLHSEAGRGTLFWFEIPLQKQAADAPPVRQSDLHDAIATALRPRPQTPAAAAPTAAPASANFAPTSEATATPPTAMPWSDAEDACGFGGRVLVVEDNPVNQAVAAAMLESLGVVHALVDNGRFALDRLRQERFDLILMDCQMPEMDGFQTTAQIRARQREGLLRQLLPIVALTANAVEGDRERCLAAGMDDYLSKPVTRERLAATLARWLPRPEPAPANVPAGPSALAPLPGKEVVAASEDPINPRALDAIRNLPGPNGALLVQKVIGAYLADTPPRFAQLRAAVTAGDAKALRKTAHALKSSSANVGAEALAALCKALEMLGRQSTVDGAMELLKDLESELPRVLATLQTMINRSSNNAIA
ncbi:MAG: response regulator [Candidatus Accumulibacter sp.]|uniref:Virulence sensor protein BvgS n=1 Tax=Candidatus Accumulibacter proximus TaxID=2954385 RepID=A0A935UFP8_9PROT|nr:response regulator [Candidatus Accumulibacter proximus]